VNRSTIFMIALIVLIWGCGLGGGAIDISIMESPTQLAPSTPLVVDCDPPLQRTLRSGSIFVDLDHQWHPEDPWDFIIVEGIGEVEISAILVSSTGIEYSSSIAGRAGGFLNLRFEPEVPKAIEFSAVRLESSAPMRIRSISWYLYNPL